MQQFKHIAGIYRLTNKKAPSKHSEYTNITYKPVENLLSKEFYLHLSPKLKSLLLDSIFQCSLKDLYEVVRKMLEEERKKANSLLKFSKESSNKNSDYQNICLQMHLDVRDLEDTIVKLGGSRDYMELQDLYNMINSYMGSGYVDTYK